MVKGNDEAKPTESTIDTMDYRPQGKFANVNVCDSVCSYLSVDAPLLLQFFTILIVCGLFSLVCYVLDFRVGLHRKISIIAPCRILR